MEPAAFDPKTITIKKLIRKGRHQGRNEGPKNEGRSLGCATAPRRRLRLGFNSINIGHKFFNLVLALCNQEQFFALQKTHLKLI